MIAALYLILGMNMLMSAESKGLKVGLWEQVLVVAFWPSLLFSILMDIADKKESK